MTAPLVGIAMGSPSDLPKLEKGLEVLKSLEIPFEVRILSAHRTPAETAAWAETARQRGLKVLVCAAGGAAHLAGAVAAHTLLPVIGVPIATEPFQGLDSLLSTVQMPPGVPVATVAAGAFGATNFALLAAQILALTDEKIAARVAADRKRRVEQSLRSDREVQDGLGAIQT